MSEEEKFKPSPEGSIKVQHVVINNLMPNIPHKTPKADTAWMLVFTDKFNPAPATKMISNALFEGGAAQFNEELKEDLESGFEPGEKATITSVMGKHTADGKGFWSIKSIKKGHTGAAGKFAPGVDPNAQQPQGNSGGGKPYDASGPIKGKLENWALNLATTKATKTTSFNDVLTTAAEYLESADASLVSRITAGVEKLYANTQNKVAKTEKEPTGKAANKAEPVDNKPDDLDDDIPW